MLAATLAFPEITINSLNILGELLFAQLPMNAFVNTETYILLLTPVSYWYNMHHYFT